MKLVWLLLIVVVAMLVYLFGPWGAEAPVLESGSHGEAAPSRSEGEPGASARVEDVGNGSGGSFLDCPTCRGEGKVVCPRCRGEGEVLRKKGVNCAQCGGQGQITLRLNGRTVPCPGCRGTGKVEREVLDECPRCKGRGRITCEDCEGSGRRRVIPEGVRRYLPGDDD